MPFLAENSYQPAWLYRHAHLATSLPTLLRKVAAPAYVRRRLELPDGDFLDLDCLFGDDVTAPTAVLCHGLEGNARRQYMAGMARALQGAGWNVAAMNYRGCSGEPNRLARSYHSGATEDLRAVIDHLEEDGRPVTGLVGFSLGGNLVLKYLGEDPEGVTPHLLGAVAFSVPVDLKASGRRLAHRSNHFYQRRFLRKLARKIREKAALLPGQVDPSGLDRVRSLRDFDELYTGPLHGFAGADDYYAHCSSKQFLATIRVPCLLVSAQDDPFLPEECYPNAAAAASAHLFLQTPRHGGHVGFRRPGGLYWSEERARDFLSDLL